MRAFLMALTLLTIKVVTSLFSLVKHFTIEHTILKLEEKQNDNSNHT